MIYVVETAVCEGNLTAVLLDLAGSHVTLRFGSSAVQGWAPRNIIKSIGSLANRCNSPLHAIVESYLHEVVMEPATVAGLVAAEQAISTTVEVGVPAAYGLLFSSTAAISSALY